jgi:RNA-binding protein
MPLDAETRKRLRGIGHALHPLVTVAGNGLSDAVCAEVERALSDHELIKVRLAIADRHLRRQLARELCKRMDAEAVQEIGKVVLVYRHNPDADPHLSNLRRTRP